MERDFKAYHESIGKELQASQDRIRNLIGDVGPLLLGQVLVPGELIVGVYRFDSA